MIGGVNISEIMWTGGLPQPAAHLRKLPHLPGVPHLRVNRPLCPCGILTFVAGIYLSDSSD